MTRIKGSGNRHLQVWRVVTGKMRCERDGKEKLDPGRKDRNESRTTREWVQKQEKSGEKKTVSGLARSTEWGQSYGGQDSKTRVRRCHCTHIIDLLGVKTRLLTM